MIYVCEIIKYGKYAIEMKIIHCLNTYEVNQIDANLKLMI